MVLLMPDLLLDGRPQGQRGVKGERLTDGSPVWLPWVESWLVGAAFWATHDDVLVASIDVQPEDFRDETLGVIWHAALDLETVSVATVCALLMERGELDAIGGEERIVSLMTAPSAFLHSGPSSILAHSSLVKDWSNRRRAMREAQGQMQAAYAGHHSGGLRVQRKGHFE